MASNDSKPLTSDQKVLLLCSFAFIMVAIIVSDAICTIAAVVCLFLVPLFSDSEEKKTSGKNKMAESPSFSTMNANKAVESVSFSTKNANKVVKKVKEGQKEPEAWLQLKEIYPDAEKEEYWNNNSGTWDLDGLREDLNLMIKRNGVEPKNAKTSEDKKSNDIKILDKLDDEKVETQKKEKQNDSESEDINRLENLKEIKSMLSEGLIDKSEFNELKKEIFGK